MSRVRRRGAAGLLAVILAGAVPIALSAQDRYALVVSGASGGAAFQEKHAQWRNALVTALRSGPRFDEDHLIVLAETPGPGVGRASRAGVRQALDRLAGRMGEDAVLYVVLIGHGSFDGVDAKFNLVGPDLEAREWGRVAAGAAGAARLRQHQQLQLPLPPAAVGAGPHRRHRDRVRGAALRHGVPGALRRLVDR